MMASVPARLTAEPLYLLPGGEGVLVVIPTYNERENLPRLVPLVLAQGVGIHILIVDDGSPDGTGAVADALSAASEGRVHVLHRTEKSGLGRAYVAGFRWGLARGYRVLGEMDADLSHPADRIPAILERFQTADVVLGSRYVGGRANVVNWPITRLFISLFGSWYARIITGLPVADATGGFNFFRREVLESVHLDRIESNGYSFQIELKFRAWKQGFRLVEVPIVFTEREEGESKMSRAIVREAIWRVWRLRLQAMLNTL
jgi:dolichol-phosphate mannosyltransferase